MAKFVIILLLLVFVASVFHSRNFDLFKTPPTLNQSTLSTSPSPIIDEFNGKVTEISLMSKKSESSPKPAFALINVGGYFVYVFDDTLILNADNQKVNFPSIKIGSNIKVKGKPGEGQIAADEIKILK